MRRKLDAEAAAREVLPGVSSALLKELHLLTRDGELNADSLRKLKQVNHFLGLLRPAVEDVLGRFADPVVVDCGAGKGYLGFLLHEVFLIEKGRVLMIESRDDLVRAGRERAKRLGIGATKSPRGGPGSPSPKGEGGDPGAKPRETTTQRIEFVHAEIEAAVIPAHVQLVTALHACDTATDDAILLGLRSNADHIAVVPCCQAEVAKQLDDSAPMGPLFEHAWHKREFGSHLTNVMRVLALESKGYKVTVTELTGWEHSVKNELILARKVRASDAKATAKLESLSTSTGAKPKLIRALQRIG